MDEHGERTRDEVRAALRWMADLVDPATDSRRAVGRARRRVARTLTVAVLSVGLCVYGGFAAVGALTGGVARHPRPAAASSCGSTWAVVPSADVPGQSSELAAVAAISRDDVWAAGYHFRERPHHRPLIEHWDGTAWSIVQGGVTRGDGLLGAMAAAGPDDVWAGGFTGDGALLEHWDGSEWSVRPVPVPGTSSFIGSLALISADDGWAVGGYTANGRSRTLTIRWDGADWTVVPSPNVPGQDTSLTAVTFAGRDDVWAVGFSQAPYGHAKPLAMRWDGTSWSIVPTPSPMGGGTLTDVGADRSGTVWAVGTNNAVTAGLILRWDGSGWTRVPPSVGGANPIGVSAFDPSDAFAYGNWSDFSKVLVEHWDGSSWTQDRTPSPGSSFNAIADLQQAGGRRWAVGASGDGTTLRTLVLRSCPEA